MALKSKTEFLRYEFKYLLPNDLRNAVEAELGHFMDFDPFVREQPNRKYLVRSLYFDDPFNTAFYQKIDGLLSRKKFRLRTYVTSPSDLVPVFLEQKGRHNNLVVKVRTQLASRATADIPRQQQCISDIIIRNAGKGPVLDKFQYDLYKKSIRPVALIDYTRRPYISRLDAEFRLTFDDNLYATPAQTLWPEGALGRKSCVSGYTIMEVKFRYHMPAWFHAVLQSFNLQRVSISKIVCGMKTLQLAEDLS